MSTIESTKITKGHLVSVFERMKACNELGEKLSLANVAIKDGEGIRHDAWIEKEKLSEIIKGTEGKDFSGVFFDATMVDVSGDEHKVHTAPCRHLLGDVHACQNILLDVQLYKPV